MTDASDASRAADADDGETIGVDVVASGALAAHLPAGERPGRGRVTARRGDSVADLLVALGVAPERPLLIVLNGSVVTPDARAGQPLADGDALSLAPPIRAG